MKTYKLIGADGKAYQSEVKGRLGGYNRNKHKLYGRLDCRSALSFLAKGQYADFRVFFADEPTAVAAGYRPCAKCMPGEYKRWKLSRA